MNATPKTNNIEIMAENVYSKRISFLVAFLVVLVVTIRICMITGFIPDSSDSSTQSNAGSLTTATMPTSPLELSPLAAVNGMSGSQATAQATNAPSDGALNMNGELPQKISIPSINLSATIANPASTNIETLDTYLLKGSVRYPTSATLGENGNMVLFGHSSYLPVVFNHAYKTFDGIQNLKVGDKVIVYGTQNVYTYSVTGEQKENTATSQGIALSSNGPTLTLATCDSFATKSDRFVVTATLVSSSPLGS
jgi:LPXTG-site transpeptidase (sortase) family protein